MIKDKIISPFTVYEGTPSIWCLADILIWLRNEKTYEIDKALLEVSKTNMNFNLARSWENQLKRFKKILKI
ncbi:hypothetical protein [Pseudanabaena yagii]|uniref:Uncharacterized protein n=1 Tax=Pseudanabaena yagii GIHE-NHR1 TaxID=2722753 RepID=A0ABX1LP51_9CYAN|nr:hypothetical protein [Pseudanabaena yagii]NMF57905.1 hypothetical protein [Pseudanabaena yagii GIHE-NHR1]